MIGKFKFINNYLMMFFLSQLTFAGDCHLENILSSKIVHLYEAINWKVILKCDVKAKLISFKIEKFPKCENFIKRFFIVDENKFYSKNVKYHVLLFPNNSNNLELDPLIAKIHYLNNDKKEIFEIIQSEKIRISTISLKNDIQSVLIGKHYLEESDTIEENDNNTIIKKSIKITGPGAFELFDTSLFTNNSNTPFYISKKINVIEDNLAVLNIDYAWKFKKTDKYNFINIHLPYYDYVNNDLVVKNLDIRIPKLSNENYVDKKVKNNRIFEFVYKNEENFYIFNFLRKKIGIIAFFILLIVNFISIASLKKNILNYFENYFFFRKIGNNNITIFSLNVFLRKYLKNERYKNKSLVELIKFSELSQKSKDYFYYLIENVENITFSKDKNQLKKIFLDKKSFKELFKLIIPKKN